MSGKAVQNFGLAVGLVAFVGGVYTYTIRRMQTVRGGCVAVVVGWGPGSILTGEHCAFSPVLPACWSAPPTHPTAHVFSVCRMKWQTCPRSLKRAGQRHPSQLHLSPPLRPQNSPHVLAVRFILVLL